MSDRQPAYALAEKANPCRPIFAFGSKESQPSTFPAVVRQRKISEEKAMYGSEGVKRSRQPVVSVLVVSIVSPFPADLHCSSPRFQSEFVSKTTSAPCCVIPKTPKVSETLTESRDCLHPYQFRKSKASSRKQDTKKERWVLFLEMEMGLSVPMRFDSVVGVVVDMDDEGWDEEPYLPVL
jgi:hypothetical protein